ncbi:TNFAIP3-interacting protein 3 isoform X2 [Erinaceus europaeus]|uniref:TNFAIP3-interacting protein 3 isoform X2 n=1 Tax=Erinaceus europaeus TaxID=9365 RepID=A0ABM3WZS5_ERIEU|nr:TNFAIP3-interacting protein 3 isoform X2 [Erinaceus europaeus]
MSKTERHEEKLVMFTNQSEDSERCESMELDNSILDLIERNKYPDPKGVTTLGALTSHRNSCALKTPGKAISGTYFLQDTRRMNTAEGSMENVECAQSSRRKNLISSLEHKIKCLERQRKELLEVNQLWDQQFTSMKELYKKKVAELEKKLEATEGFLSEQEQRWQQQSQKESLWPPDYPQEQLQHPEKGKVNLHEELQELRKENKHLKEKNALTNKKKEHYECEIRRLNKALQDILKIECSSFPKPSLGKPEMKCSQEELRTEMEVLKQQVQIYEEDFKKERSDRERLNQEKEELQKINQTSQSQLNRLHSKIKACQMEKEKLEKQLKQIYFQSCNCGLGLHLWDPSTTTAQGAAQEPQKLQVPQRRKSVTRSTCRESLDKEDHFNFSLCFVSAANIHYLCHFCAW